MRGPNPHPTALKIVTGSAKHDPQRINKDEPIPTGDLGDPPKDLSARAKEIWKGAPFWLSDSDRNVWTRYCIAEADSEFFYAQCEIEGWWIEGSRGTLVLHPASRLYKEACDRADKLAIEFGMTPSSRTRVKVPQRPDTNDPLAGR